MLLKLKLNQLNGWFKMCHNRSIEVTIQLQDFPQYQTFQHMHVVSLVGKKNFEIEHFFCSRTKQNNVSQGLHPDLLFGGLVHQQCGHCTSHLHVYQLSSTVHTIFVQPQSWTQSWAWLCECWLTLTQDNNFTKVLNLIFLHKSVFCFLCSMQTVVQIGLLKLKTQE